MKKILLVLCCAFSLSSLMAQSQAQIESLYKAGRNSNWVEVINEPMTSYDSSKWVLDGEKSRVDADESGLMLSAGAALNVNAYHTVLWHKNKLNSGDLLIEYDYTRIDKSSEGSVNILYILAQGSQVGEYTKDIMEWNHLRREPAMRVYFDNMNTYHISYSVERGPNDPTDDYIRGRLYNPTAEAGLKGTDLKPEYFDVNLFEPNVKYHITVMLRGDKMFMEVEGNDRRELFWFGLDPETRLIEGYLGFRHMWGRCSKYANLKVSELAK